MSTRTRKSKGSWVYIGNQADEKQTKQVAQCGDIVESDTMLFDAKGNAVGTKFIFVRFVSKLALSLDPEIRGLIHVLKIEYLYLKNFYPN